jgi:hypothetical protein
MLFWKLLVALDLVIAAGYSASVWKGHERLDAFDFISIPVALIGIFGLTTYAFSVPTVPELIWRIFLPVFVSWSGWEVAQAASKDGIGVDTIFGIVQALLLVGFTSVALYRLGGSHWIGIAGL